jgi:hydroxymethylglutaryl-CoA reductase
MGANIINTITEGVGPRLATMFNARVALRILTNLCTKVCYMIYAITMRCANAAVAVTMTDNGRLDSLIVVMM